MGNFLIRLVIGSILTQLHQPVETLFRAFHLHIARVGADFKLIHFVRVDAIVGIGMMLVVRFTHVQHGIVAAIDEHMHWLPCLVIYIEAASRHHLLNGNIPDAATSVITTIANL